MTGRRGTDFDDFVRARSPALLRVAYLLTGDRHAAEDLLQEVLERVYVRWHRVRSSPEAYARRALVTRAANRWRRRGRRGERTTDNIEAAGSGPAMPDAAEHTVVREVVVAALRSLPPRQRAAVVLRFLEDLPVVEVARILDCSEGTVKSHTARGLAHLRDALAGSGLAARVPDREMR